MTDSGGIQEEAPSLRKPVLVIWDTTERPEGRKAGILQLAGTVDNVINDSFTTLLTDPTKYEKMSTAIILFGGGLASKRIADILEAE